MAGRLKRRGRDATLRALKVESLLNLKRPRKKWGSWRGLLASGDISSERDHVGLGGGELTLSSVQPVVQYLNARR